MKYFLISDNVDTLAGMRLVGVRGVVVHEPEEMNQALEKACADPEIGLVLITDKLVAKCADVVFAYKPVSYTHLDVYKRQRPSSSFCKVLHSRSSPPGHISRRRGFVS